MKEIEKRLAAIESLLQRLPELQAAAFIQMWDEYQSALIRGQKPSDLWEIAPTAKR